MSEVVRGKKLIDNNKQNVDIIVIDRSPTPPYINGQNTASAATLARGEGGWVSKHTTKPDGCKKAMLRGEKRVRLLIERHVRLPI
jgi:hypothetical protein